MSQYKFKRKKNEAKEENKIMNANATPEESTAVFLRTPIENLVKSDDIDPYADDNRKEKKKKKNKNKSEKKKNISIFKTFSKHSDYSDGDDIDTSQAEILAKAEDIINSNDVSVEQLKETLTGEGKISLSDVFSSKKPSDPPTQPEETVATTSIEETGNDGNEEDVFEDSSEQDEEQDIYDDSDTLTDIPTPPKPVKAKRVKEIREFKSPDDKEDFLDGYHKKEKTAILSLIFSLISLLALIYLETKKLPHPKWLSPGDYSFIYLMFDLQFVLISAVCVFSAIKNGAKALFTWKPDKNSVTFIAFLVSLLQIILHIIFSTYSHSINLYSSVFGACAVVTTLISFIETKREYLAFRIAASSKAKITVSKLDETSAESNSFGEFLPENSSMYKITKTSFLEDFVKTNMRSSSYNDNYKVSIPLVFVASIVFAAIGFILTKDSDISHAINNFTIAFMMGLPLSSLFIVALPFYITSLRLSKSHSAIIGESSIEEFANAPLVSFTDIDVFNPKGITITSIKTYGKTRIDNTYLFAAKVFKLVGGPLEDVFDRSVIYFENNKAENSILSITENGINAMIDSCNVLVGNESFMMESGLSLIDDDSDKDYLKTPHGKILYVAVNGEISAKFYIKYVLGTKFKKLLDSFSNLGVCIAVNTRDPNIDTNFLLKILRDKSYPIVAVKNTDIPTEESKKPVEQASGGIVSTSSIYDVLRTFIAADRLSHIISINTLVKYISLILAFTLIVVAFLTDASHEKITPLFIILYQLVWSIPIIGTSILR